jgi:hypothetical protein
LLKEIGNFSKKTNGENEIVWYRFASELKFPPKPGTIEIPEGMVRRFHYTSEDELLDKIAEEGIRVDKSQSWKYGDPKAVWSNSKIVNENKPTVEYFEDPKHIIHDQYQFKDVSPDQIIALHRSWHPYLHCALENFSPEEAIRRIRESDAADIWPYNKVLEELLKYVV